MSVDLRSKSQFARVSVLLMDDCIIKLEHRRTEDRMRKIMYESIESITFQRRLPGLRIALCAVFLVLPGIAIQFVGNEISTVIGIFLIVLGSGLIIMYLVCGHTIVRILKGGKYYEIAGVFRPRKLRKFREKLLASIRSVQMQSIPAPATVAFPNTPTIYPA